MKNSREYHRLRVYCSSTDKTGGKPLYQELVKLARESGLAGSTVFRGVLGYGESTVIHSSKLWELTEKLPMVVEILDEKQKIENFLDIVLPVLQELPKGLMVTRETVQLVLRKPGRRIVSSE